MAFIYLSLEYSISENLKPTDIVYRAFEESFGFALDYEIHLTDEMFY